MTQAHLIIASALQSSNSKINQTAQQIAQQQPPPSAAIAMQFYNTVIWPTLSAINVSSRDWAALLLGTAIAESGLSYRTQIGGGPGLGVYQVERRTHRDNWENWLRYGQDPDVLRESKASLPASISASFSTLPTLQQIANNIKAMEQELINNDVYATLMAYTWYRRRMGNTPPNRRVVLDMGKKWKQHYNITGAGTAKKFETRWNNFIGSQRIP